MSQSVEDLIASYTSQSPLAFTVMAIQTGEEEKKDYNAPKNAEQNHGDAKCEYPCCSERGYCATPAQHAADRSMLHVLLLCNRRVQRYLDLVALLI